LGTVELFVAAHRQVKGAIAYLTGLIKQNALWYP
jgi:hypothetical protein